MRERPRSQAPWLNFLGNALGPFKGYKLRISSGFATLRTLVNGCAARASNRVNWVTKRGPVHKRAAIGLVEGEVIMKRGTILWLTLSLTVGIVNVPNVVSAQNYGRYDRGYDTNDNRWDGWRNTKDDRRDVEGTWYLNGHRDMRAEIVSSRRGLEATNERGDTTRLEINRSGNVHALDWEGGLRGNVRPDRIEWENGTTWMRQPFYRYGRFR